MAFSSDFIVGYPGETDKDFQESFSKNVTAFNELHVIFSFTFCPFRLIAHQIGHLMCNTAIK